MSFESIAKEIVKNSIRSAVCVDNAFVEPYYDALEGEDKDTPKRLFESFRKENCNLDIYKYIDRSKWERDREHILSNHDLLILDWELVGEPPFQDSLEILWEAVNLQSLPFVLIYTQEPDTSIIELNICSFFGTPYTDITERRTKYEEFCTRVELETEIDASRLFESIFTECKQLILCYDRKIIADTFVEQIRKYCEKEDLDFKSIMNKMMSLSKSMLNILNIENLLKFLVFHIGNTLVNTKGNSIQIFAIDGAKHSFVINNTTITIFMKPKTSNPESEIVISPDRVYRYFAESIYKPPRNFLALLSLEMKTLYREKSGIIGNELYNIDEIAFFHHQKNLNSEDDFYDFLRNCWKDQLSAFNLIQSPKLFSVLEEYKKRDNIGEKIEQYKEKDLERLQEELVKLNYSYSFFQIERKKNDRIRFGDLFILSKDAEGKQYEGFVLSITPHCDCLHTENINDKFYFVFGNKIDIGEGLSSAEQGFHSFLIYKGESICIRWNSKPFTLYIPKAQNNVSEPIEIKYHESDRYLIFEATQKESYTQRIANESFSHASRVGIDLAGLKKVEEKQE